MEHRSLESSFLKSAAYDPGLMLLEIQFKNGKRYRYTDVPEELFYQLSSSESCGKFFGEFIKGKFESVEVEQKEGEHNGEHAS